ncbi:aspartic peptidase domain-containing protein [Lentinula lateritia]|uniref:Aspartic peptidase domain-containing protein n=1 Tax=Lentinula lateritia TaxID=40482 RepID=A0ABQ8VAA8_9AGAR|nr:aspartic peptidase domain-containing protein [Lentinula lateritia]
MTSTQHIHSMFTKSALVAFVTLATLAASTLMQPRQAGGPIALPKRSSSSTSSKESGSFSIEYGDGSTVSGPVYEDTVAVADPADGILGLAFPAISNLDADPFFVNANSQGAVDSNDLGFYLASSGSELYLGGTNSDLYSGSIEYHDVDTSTGF